jgi:hypothetical protein
MNAVSSPAARKRRRARANVARVGTICAAFGVLIGVGILFARDPAAFFGWNADAGAGGQPGAVKPVALVGGAELGPSDLTVRFSKTGVGHVLFATSDSDQCRRILFDNRTGLSYQANDVFCGQVVAEPVVEPDSPDRLLALRKSFQR